MTVSEKFTDHPGFEPGTFRSLNWCSTNWANESEDESRWNYLNALMGCRMGLHFGFYYKACICLNILVLKYNFSAKLKLSLDSWFTMVRTYRYLALDAVLCLPGSRQLLRIRRNPGIDSPIGAIVHHAIAKTWAAILRCPTKRSGQRRQHAIVTGVLQKVGGSRRRRAADGDGAVSPGQRILYEGAYPLLDGRRVGAARVRMLEFVTRRESGDRMISGDGAFVAARRLVQTLVSVKEAVRRLAATDTRLRLVKVQWAVSRLMGSV